EFIIVGDMNFYTSSETGYQKFIADEINNISRAEDLCTEVGSWHDNASYAEVHSQSSRYEAFGYGASGGLDDKFDFIFGNYGINNGSGIEYNSHSFTSYGNDGAHFNLSVNDETNSAVPDSVADALYYASDHLPVYVDFTSISGIQTYLIISEYIEGSSNNKALEIYNGTGAAVNLAGYEIWRISNGGDWAEGESNAVSLEGILENNDVYVICNSNANAEIQAVSDLIGTTATYYNGNDAVGLAHNGILIDAIGEEGPDVGIAWDVAGTTEATLNHTLVRKPDILQGNMNWALSAGTNTENSEWFVYNEDTFDYLGYHSVSGEDTYPPIMTSAFATSITSVEITFNEALDETTSEDITNYSITPYLNISSASLSTNNVTLTTDEQVEEQIYTITVNNVEDLVGNPITP
ncbi:MAG: lamin tail domain-containing protein, partial [Candidatus Cloacimonetes bacterium]|nr:lamin tail domain-containing protein [Candidatus Cloacimonadota bacterium]